MSIVSKEELLQAIAGIVGEVPDDNGLAIIENLTDTISDYETKVVDAGDWENKYNQLDSDWRKRYTERFMGTSDADHFTSPEEAKEDQEEDVKKDGEELTFEDLFEKSEP